MNDFLNTLSREQLMVYLTEEKKQYEQKLTEEKKQYVVAEKKITELEKDLAAKEEEIKKMKPMLCIRKKIEVYESLLAPELKDQKSVFNHSVIKSTNQLMDFHEAKWNVILSKVSDPRVVRLNGLISSANISPSVFCRTMGSFFLIASGGMHLPKLSSYSTQEMENILRTEFQIYDSSTISCVTDVLMAV